MRQKMSGKVTFFRDEEGIVVCSGSPAAVAKLAKDSGCLVRINRKNPLAGSMKGWQIVGNWVHSPQRVDPYLFYKSDPN